MRARPATTCAGSDPRPAGRAPTRGARATDRNVRRGLGLGRAAGHRAGRTERGPARVCRAARPGTRPRATGRAAATDARRCPGPGHTRARGRARALIRRRPSQRQSDRGPPPSRRGAQSESVPSPAATAGAAGRGRAAAGAGKKGAGGGRSKADRRGRIGAGSQHHSGRRVPCRDSPAGGSSSHSGRQVSFSEAPTRFRVPAIRESSWPPGRMPWRAAARRLVRGPAAGPAGRHWRRRARPHRPGSPRTRAACAAATARISESDATAPGWCGNAAHARRRAPRWPTRT
jgi:hypothetical protein